MAKVRYQKYLSYFLLFCVAFSVKSITENATQNKRKYERYYLISYFSHFFLSKKSQNSFLRPKIICNFCLKFKLAFQQYVCTAGKTKKLPNFRIDHSLCVFQDKHKAFLTTKKTNLFRNAASKTSFFGLNDTFQVPFRSQQLIFGEKWL